MKQDGFRASATKPNGARAPSRARITPFALGTAGIALLLSAYYARTWSSLTSAFGVCAQPFCDFVDYYYPMGEAVFRTGLPVEGFLYSPFVAVLLAAFPPLGIGASLVLWGVLQVLSVILCLFLFRRLVTAGLPVQLLFVALTLSSYPLLLNYLWGSVSAFILAALFGLFILYEHGRLATAAALLAFAAGFKFYPLIFLAAFAARRDARFLLFAVAACLALLLGVPAVFLGAGGAFGFYGGLFDAYRGSGWVVTNPHSQFLPHLVFRLAGGAGLDAHAWLPLLHWIAFGVATANIGLLFLIQRARLRHADLWSLQVLFLTIPFVLKTSWPGDFAYLPFAQALLAWRLWEGEEPAVGTHAGGRHPRPDTWRERVPPRRMAMTFLLLLPSIAVSNIVFFHLFDNFTAYGFLGFLFWANLLLLAASYLELLPRALRAIRDEGR